MAEGYFTRQKWLFLTAYFKIDIMQCNRAAFGVEVIHSACYILGDMFQLSLCLFAMMICNNLGMWVTVTVMKTLCCDSQFMKSFWGKFQPLFFHCPFSRNVICYIVMYSLFEGGLCKLYRIFPWDKNSSGHEQRDLIIISYLSYSIALM